VNLQTYDGSTSASGSMVSSSMMAHRPLRGSLHIEGTTALHLLGEDWEHELVPLPQTNAGRMQIEEEEKTQSTSSAIMELRRLSGLTWEQLATLFNVARRSLHFWASGKPVNASNEEHLRRVLAVVRRADRGFAAKNRSILFEDRDGVVPFDLLARGEYDTFIDLVLTGPGRREVKLAPLSPEALEARKPQPPEELVGALQDRVHVEKGRLLLATPIRRKRQE
jgi:DNA-binding transcriptional regulator YiaG